MAKSREISEGGGRIVRRNEVQGVAFPSVDIPKCGVTDADCLLQHGCKHPLKITGGTTNNLKHVRCGSLLLQSLCEVRSALPAVR